ncbi:MAG: hypothetical protein R3D29_11230 [Nitratireductor sp.]
MRQRMVSLEAASIRLQALLDGVVPVYPENFSKANPELIARSNTEYEAARAGFEASVASFEEVVRQRKSRSARPKRGCVRRVGRCPLLPNS